MTGDIEQHRDAIQKAIEDQEEYHTQTMLLGYGFITLAKALVNNTVGHKPTVVELDQVLTSKLARRPVAMAYFSLYDTVGRSGPKRIATVMSRTMEAQGLQGGTCAECEGRNTCLGISDAPIDVIEAISMAIEGYLAFLVTALGSEATSDLDEATLDKLVDLEYAVAFEYCVAHNLLDDEASEDQGTIDDMLRSMTETHD